MRKQERPEVFMREPEPNRARRPYNQYDRQRATIMLPTGRLEKDVKSFFKAIGLEFKDTDRKYFIQADNMPVDFVMIKAQDIPRLVSNPFPQWGTIGVTGSDILWEQERSRTGLDRNSGDELLMKELVPDYQQSSLYVGVSKDLVERIREEEGRDPKVEDLDGRPVVTRLPNITGDFFRSKGIRIDNLGKKNDILPPPSGAEEAWQYLNRTFEGIVGVTQTGKTAKLNDIQILEKFYDVSVRLINADWERYDSRISTTELGILNDLREMTYVALQKKKTGL